MIPVWIRFSTICICFSTSTSRSAACTTSSTPSRSAASCAPVCMSMKNGLFRVFSTRATRGFAGAAFCGGAARCTTASSDATHGDARAVRFRVVMRSPSRCGTGVRRFLSSESTSTAAMITTPITICCRNDEMPSRFRPLRSTPMMSAPISVPPSVPEPPMQAGAADHGRGDRVELVHHARDGLRRVEARGQQHGGHGARHPGQHVDHRLVEAHGHAGEPRRLLVAADRVDVAAEARAREHEVRDGVDDDGDEDRRRDHRAARPVASAAEGLRRSPRSAGRR